MPMPGGGSTILEDVHVVERVLGWYPAGPLKEDDQTTGTIERERRVREHDLVKFLAKHGGIRVVRVKDLTVL